MTKSKNNINFYYIMRIKIGYIHFISIQVYKLTLLFTHAFNIKTNKTLETNISLINKNN